MDRKNFSRRDGATRTDLCALAVALTFVAASPAAAQESYDPPRHERVMAPRLHLRGVLAGGGEVRLETDAGNVDDDLDIGFGGGLEIEVPIVPFVSFGGAATVTAWQADLGSSANLDRNIVADFDLVLRLRLPFEGSVSHGALYVGAPIGLALNFLNDTYSNAVGALGGDLSPGIGLHLGGRLGGQLFVTRGFGFVLEGGFDYRAISHRLEIGSNDERFVLRMIHFTGQAGFLLAL